MVIKASAATEIRELIAALGGIDEVRREAAIARLAVIGPRAVDGLRRAYTSASDRDTKIAVLRALESAGDRRTVAVARDAMAEGGDVAVAATAALRGLLDSPHGPTGTDALDVLVAAVLDPAVERRVRLAAFDALQGMPEGVRARVAEALQSDPDPGLKARAPHLSRDAAAADAVWQDALEGRLPDTPRILGDVAHVRAAAAALSTLQKMIEAVRTREGTVTSTKRAEWQVVRGALHQVLALRGSRVAVYDLRESLQDARGHLPTSFLAALHAVGDESCLEPLVGAYVRAPADDARWRVQLAAAFRAIARREKVTRKHAVMKRIATRWPEAVRELTARA
jgi:HEAT repeat protein